MTRELSDLTLDEQRRQHRANRQEWLRLVLLLDACEQADEAHRREQLAAEGYEDLETLRLVTFDLQRIVGS